ncbi:MAG: Ig-like domain-containing protein, partial [Wenzhouxiangella sp.]|nr:Ig-like domain-containing protein [Wenzhouxiangella sp.]
MGESQVIWDAFSMISVMDNLFIYVPGLPKGLVKKLGPRGLKVAEVLLDVAVETGLVAATQAVDSFITPLPSGAVNRQVQRVIVRDIEPPIFENITRSSFVFEAVEPGGTSFDSLDFSGRPNGEILREAFTVRDPCDRPVQLIPDAGFWPLGGPSIHRWIAVDPGPNALGLSNETILTQTITVRDTLEPVILAPDDIVVESGTGSALLSPGQPQVFDLGDVDPAISNDGLPADGQGRISFPLGVNELRWTAEDSSGNTASATQIVNVKLPGANRPPQAQPTTLNARTFEFSEVTLDATDPDLDPLSYRIADWPEHGFFSAPLYPYFIEDFRLPLGTACTPNRDPELVEKPEFVQTTDTGITYVLNRELVNPCTSPPFGGRISVFDSDGNFLLGRDMPPSADLNGLQLDTGRNEILYTAFDRSTFQPQLFVLDGTDLSTRRLYTTAGMASGFDSALIDDQEILYVSTGTSEIEIYDLREAIQDSGVQFTLPPAAGTLDVCHPDQALCSNSTFASRDLALTPDGALIVSTERRIHRFDPLDRDASGAIVFPGEARWLGACVSGEGCDPERQASRGFSCVSDGTCLSDFDAPRDGPGQLDGVFGLAVDPNGIIYAADRNNRRVQRFTPEGSYAGQARNECPAGQRCFVLGDFGSPQSISVNARQLLVVDSDLDLVHSFETSVIDPQEDGTAQVRYRSVEGFQGSDSFSFIATDGLDDSPPATVAVTVARNFRPPVAAEDTVSRGPEDTAIPVTLFASDPDGSLDTLTYEIVEPPALGSLSGSGRDRIYTPPLNFEGEQSFSFRVFDGREFSETVEHIIVVEPVNDPPVLELVSVGVAESRGSTPQVTVPLGYPAEFRLRYEDPDAIDQYTVSVEWGGLEATQPEDTDASDGSIDGPVLVDQQSGSGEILALYTYQRVGTRTANFCLTDNIMLIDGVKTPTESSLTSCLPVSVTADPMADVQVQILAPPVVTARQESVTVEFQVHNRQPDLGGGIVGGLDATNLRLEASLSGAGTFESFITQPAASCSDSPTRRDCSLDDLAPGETVILRQIVDINPDAGSLLALDVEVWTDTVDPRLPNRQTLDIPIGPDADILVTQEADESTACQLLCDGPGPCEANGLVPECSLRSALALANSRTGTQRILLGDGVFELDRDGSDGAWTVSDDLQLLGLGAGRTRVSGAGTDRVIRMENPASLVLEDLSVVNGLIDSSGGGGILTTSDGDLILRRVQVQG